MGLGGEGGGEIGGTSDVIVVCSARKYITYNNYYIRWLAIAGRSPGSFWRRRSTNLHDTYRIWTPRECLRCPARISEADLLCCESASAPSRRSGPRLQNTFVTLSSPRRSPPGPPEAEGGRRRASLVELSISAEVCKVIIIYNIAQIIILGEKVRTNARGGSTPWLRSHFGAFFLRSRTDLQLSKCSATSDPLGGGFCLQLLRQIISSRAHAHPQL